MLSGASTVKSCSEASAGKCRQFEQCTDWVCSRSLRQNANGMRRSVNWLDFRLAGISAGIRNQRMKMRRQEVRFAARRRITKIKAAASDDRGGNVAGARVNGRRDGGRQAGIQHAFEPETEPCDDPSHRIDHGGNAGICGTNQRQPLLDRAQARLLQMLIGTGGNSKPAVIGQVDDPARTVVARRQRHRERSPRNRSEVARAAHSGSPCVRRRVPGMNPP